MYKNTDESVPGDRLLKGDNANVIANKKEIAKQIINGTICFIIL